MADQQPGWYADPSGDTSKLRYWDGTQWTNDFTDAPTAQPETQSDAVAAPAEPVAPAPAAPGAESAQPVAAAAPAPAAQPAPASGDPYLQGQTPIPVYSQEQQQSQTPGQVQVPMQPQAPYYDPNAQAQPKKRTGLIVAVVAIVAVAIIAIVVFVVLMGGNSSSPSTSTNTNTPSSSSTPSPSSSDPIVISGEVIGEVGQEYETMWFTFTVDSMTTAQSYDTYTAADGNILVIAHITETNISGSSQDFGTFDWFLDDSSLAQYIYPLDPLNDEMMPEIFSLANGKTASYDVVIEYSASLENPYLIYEEVDEEGTTYAAIKIPIK